MRTAKYLKDAPASAKRGDDLMGVMKQDDNNDKDKLEIE